MSIILRFFPNGEFTQGVSAIGQRRDKKKHPLGGIIGRRDDAGGISAEFIDRNAEIPQETLDLFLRRRYTSPGNFVYEVVEASQRHTVLKWEDDKGVSYKTRISLNIIRVLHDWNLTPLGSSDARILTKPEKSRKLCLSMTPSMGRNLRNACYLLESRYGKDNLSFLTLTLPNLSSEGLALCCANWDKLVHRFIKWLRTKVEGHLCELEYVYCTEIQLSRLSERGEYAPHLHLVYRGRTARKMSWYITPSMARKEWIRCLKSCVSECFTTTALENLQRVEKSAQRYLSKYISKGANTISSRAGTEPVSRLCTHWGGMSRNLSRAIKKQCIRLEGNGSTGDIANTFLGAAGELLRCGLLTYWRRAFVPTGRLGLGSRESGIWVGCGKLATPPALGGIIRIIEWMEKRSQFENYCDVLSLLDKLQTTSYPAGSVYIGNQSLTDAYHLGQRSAKTDFPG